MHHTCIILLHQLLKKFMGLWDKFQIIGQVVTSPAKQLLTPSKSTAHVDVPKVLSPTVPKLVNDDLVGKHISVYWKGDDKWYTGVVNRPLFGGKYAVKYDDDEDEEESY